MTVTGIISAIFIGIVVGALGRLLLPGKQKIGILVTILVGIVSALIGTALAGAIGIPTATSGVDWLELLVQVVVAALGVGLVAALMGRGRSKISRQRPSAFRRDPGWNPDRPGSLWAQMFQRRLRMMARSLSTRVAISRSPPWVVGR